MLGDRRYVNLAGPIAMLVAMVVSIWLFSNQTKYIGPIPTDHPGVGDITFEVGFGIAVVLYAVLYAVLRPRSKAVAPQQVAQAPR
jgi:NCS1 family nucleobase:cation symporter-1